MSSIKALLQSKKQTNRLVHPYAKYDSSSRLTCILCGSQTIIKHENLWSSHLLTKNHRSKVIQAKLLEEKLEEKEVIPSGSGSNGAGKRKRVEEEETSTSRGIEKKVREDEEELEEVEEEEEEGDNDEQESGEGGGGGLPDDFFSDASMRPQLSVPSPSPSPEIEETTIQVESTEPVDEEWAAFEASLAVNESTSNATSTPIISTAKATIFSAPVMYEFGAPKVFEEGEEELKPEGEGVEGEEEEEVETEEEKAERLDREQREELLQRITEETTEQEMADEKVLVLKRRLEKIKHAREARKKKA